MLSHFRSFSYLQLICKITEKYVKGGKYFQYSTRQRVITTLSLKPCLNKKYQELSYLGRLIVLGLLNIACYIGTKKQKEKLQVLTLSGYVLCFLTALYFHISTRIFKICLFVLYLIVFFVIDLFLNLFF